MIQRFLKFLYPFIIAFPFLLLEMGCTDYDYTIDGYTSNDLTIEGRTVYLTIPDYGRIDSTIVHDGRFRLKGKLPKELQKVVAGDLRILPNHFLPIILEPNYNITADMDSYTATGSPLNDDFYHYARKIDSVEEVYFDQLREFATRIIRKEIDHSVASIDSIYYQMSVAKSLIAEETLKAHPNDALGIQAYILILAEFEEEDKDELKSITSSLGKIVLEDKRVKFLTLLKQNKKKTTVGNKYANIDLQRSDGTTISLSNLRKKDHYSLLVFWSAWCESCLMQSRELLQLYELYKKEPLDIISIQLAGEHRKNIVTEGIDVPWERVVDYNNESVINYQIKKVPSAILIDPQGYIIARNLHFRTLREELKKCFGYGLDKPYSILKSSK